MTSLVTVDAHRAWLRTAAGAGSAADASKVPDTVLEPFLLAASDCVREHCKRSWGAGVQESRTFWPSGATASRLVLGACSEVTEVRVDGYLIGVEDYVLLPAGGSGGVYVLQRKRGRWEPPTAVTVTGTYDAGAVPAGVTEAVNRISYRWIVSVPSITGLEMAVDESSIRLLRPWRDPDILMLLEPHTADVGR